MFSLLERRYICGGLGSTLGQILETIVVNGGNTTRMFIREDANMLRNAVPYYLPGTLRNAVPMLSRR